VTIINQVATQYNDTGSRKRAPTFGTPFGPSGTMAYQKSRP
jgi:hypothetical protein